MHKKRIAIIGSILSFVFAPLKLDAVNADVSVDYNNCPRKVVVTASYLNVRTGPSLSHRTRDLLARGQVLECIASIGDWNVVVMPDGSIGVVYKEFTPPESAAAIKPQASQFVPNQSALIPPTDESSNVVAPIGPNVDETNSSENELIGLVNNERKKYGLSAFKHNEKLSQVAKIKVLDMIENDYTDHNSPKYGTPEKMISDFGIAYDGTGENLSRGVTVEDAHIKLMDSASNRANILSTDFDEIGVGVAMRNGKYEIVELFIKASNS